MIAVSLFGILKRHLLDSLAQPHCNGAAFSVVSRFYVVAHLRISDFESRVFPSPGLLALPRLKNPVCTCSK